MLSVNDRKRGNGSVAPALYITALSRLPGQQAYGVWFEANAAKVWANRRVDGVMGFDWNAQAPATGMQAQCAAGEVSLLNLLATPVLPVIPAVPRSRIQRGRTPTPSGSWMVAPGSPSISSIGDIFVEHRMMQSPPKNRENQFRPWMPLNCRYDFPVWTVQA